MKHILILSAAALLGLAACNKDMYAPKGAAGHDTEITFTLGGEFAAGTRATEITTANLSSLYVTATTGTSSESAVFTSQPFSKSGSAWKGGQFWPGSDPGYHFYAANTALTHTASGATVSPANADTDIVVDYLASPTFRASNALELEHIFCQIGTVTMKAPAGYTVTDLKVSVQPVVSGTFNLKSGSWTTRGAATVARYILGSATSGVSISSAGGQVSSADNDLWLVPGSYTLTASYTITKGAYTSSQTRTATVTLLQGKNNNIGLPGTGSDQPNIPEPSDVSEIEFSVTVTPWTDNTVQANFS